MRVLPFDATCFPTMLFTVPEEPDRQLLAQRVTGNPTEGLTVDADSVFEVVPIVLDKV